MKWNDVDLAGGVIRVSRSWDDVAGAIEPESEKGMRTKLDETLARADTRGRIEQLEGGLNDVRPEVSFRNQV